MRRGTVATFGYNIYWLRRQLSKLLAGFLDHRRIEVLRKDVVVECARPPGTSGKAPRAVRLRPRPKAQVSEDAREVAATWAQRVSASSGSDAAGGLLKHKIHARRLRICSNDWSCKRVRRMQRRERLSRYLVLTSLRSSITLRHKEHDLHL